MKMYKKIAVITAMLVISLTMIQSASAKPKTLRVNGLWTTIIQDVPPTAQVGKVYTVKLKYTNRYRSHRGKKQRERVKFTAWIEWGSYTYTSPADRNPSYYWHETKPRPKTRWLKPGESRTLSFRISFNGCLPPWGAEWNSQPGDYFYSGLPCASGRYYLKSTGVVKGSRWVGGFTYPYQKNVFIVPASSQSTISAPTGPTGSSDPAGPTG